MTAIPEIDDVFDIEANMRGKREEVRKELTALADREMAMTEYIDRLTTMRNETGHTMTLARVRDLLAQESNVVRAQWRALTNRVFGED